MSSHRIPQVRRHRQKGKTDRAYINYRGQRIYLGPYGSEKARRAYSRMLAELASSKEAPALALIRKEKPEIALLVAKFLSYAEKRYSPTDLNHYRNACELLLDGYSDLVTDEFRPTSLRALRKKLIDRNLSRLHVNRQTHRIVKVFQWGVSHDMVHPDTLARLEAVESLRKGEQGVREGKKVVPVRWLQIRKTLRQVSSVVRAMVLVQGRTGMRPGELVQMRAKDLDQSDPEVWVYSPPHHKTEDRGHQRQVVLGPKAQRVLQPWLAKAGDGFLFRPKDAVEEKRRRDRAARRDRPPADARSARARSRTRRFSSS